MNRLPISIVIAVLSILSVVFVLSRQIIAQGNLTVPEVVSPQINPNQVNTTNSPQIITVTARITDDLSGFNNGFIVPASEAPSSQRHSMSFNTANLISGNGRDGLYRGSFVLPQFSAEERWLVNQITLKDQVGNEKTHFLLPVEYSQHTFESGASLQPNLINIYLPAVLAAFEDFGNADFWVAERRLWDVEENGGQIVNGSVRCGNKRELHVVIMDSDGNKLNGVTVQALFGAQETYETGTGGFGNGEVTFVLGAGQSIKVVRDADGREVTSEVADGITTHTPDIPYRDLINARYCSDNTSCDAFSRSAGCWGHYSWTVTFLTRYPSSNPDALSLARLTREVPS